MIYIGINKYTKTIWQYYNKKNVLINKYDKTRSCRQGHWSALQRMMTCTLHIFCSGKICVVNIFWDAEMQYILAGTNDAYVTPCWERHLLVRALACVRARMLFQVAEGGEELLTSVLVTVERLTSVQALVGLQPVSTSVKYCQLSTTDIWGIISKSWCIIP